MEDPTLRSNPVHEEQPASGDAGASEQAATPAEAENAPAQPSEKASPEERPSTSLAQEPATPEVPVTPPAEHMERDAHAQVETPADSAAPAAPAAPVEPARPRFSDLATGMVMEGTVTRIEKYGAFVNLGLADRREGLIHISEMAPHRIRRVEDVVKVGDSVRAKIVSIDNERRRIGLSLNEVSDDSVPQQPPAASLEPAKTAMQIAFEEARSRRKDETEADRAQQGGSVGSRKKREQEELMKRLRSSE